MRTFKKSMALLLSLAMILATFGITVVSAKNFGDTEGHWAQQLIDKWSESGVINGYEDGTFRPDENITRAELSKVISTAKQYTVLADVDFTDVSGDEWFVNDLRKCVAQGVIGGYDDGSFRPDEYVTREEASVMFQRAYNVNSIGLLSFTDVDEISSWAKNDVTALVGAGIIKGYEDGTFMPKAAVTRAEVVKILDGITAYAQEPQATSGSNSNGTGSVGTIGNLGGGSSGGSSGGNSNPDSTYSVTFNSNGGIFAGDKTQKVVSVSKNTIIGSKAPEATREGYVFDGWYTSKDAADNLIASKKFDVNTQIVSKNLGLYAGWYINGISVVSFELNGGTPKIDSQNVNNGASATAPTTVPTRAHYTFVGWYADNITSTAYDFGTEIKTNTVIYARWKVDADYASEEVKIPTKTTGSYLNGTIQSVPTSVITGEKVTFTVIPPKETYAVEGIPTITYVSKTTGETVTMATSAIKDNGDMSFSFTMPSDVENNTLEIAPKYIEALPPTATPAPTATIDPTQPTSQPGAPTATPVQTPTWEFTKGGFDGLSVFPANTAIDGLTTSKDASITGSSKTFPGTGYSYKLVCKVGTANLSFDVKGPCELTFDAVSANNSEDRGYAVYADNDKIGEYTCVAGDAPSYKCTYTGSGATIKVVPSAGINFYGIWLNYSVNIATATPAPTVDPNIEYNINVQSDIKNGNIVVNNGKTTSDKMKVITWTADSHIPEGSVSGVTTLFGDESAAVNLNEVDNTDGVLAMYEAMKWFVYVDDNGNEIKYIRGEGNPDNIPPSEGSEPTGSSYGLTVPINGKLHLELYINGGKSFKLYDNNNKKYLEQFTAEKEKFYTFDFNCEAGNTYYFWANGSKIGIKNIVYSQSLTAKAGDAITVTTIPDNEYKAGTVFTDPNVNVKSGATNTYTFTMPASDINVGATFIESSAKEYTATAVQSENGTVKLEKAVTAADASLAEMGTVLDCRENFLMKDGTGGKWIVSSDGNVDTTAVNDKTDIGGNTSDKIKLSDKAVQYALENQITSGDFELSYDFYDDNTASTGRSFRTYLDNVAHEYDQTTGQAKAMGTDGSFFHMMDVGANVYVTDAVSDLGGKVATGTQVGTNALEANKWYRVVISGTLDSVDNVNVSYYLHGTDGQYNPDNVSATPYITTNKASFTNGRNAALSQIKFMRTAGGNLYYDNISLKAQNGTPEKDEYSIKAYNGEKVNVIAEPNAGYSVGTIKVVDSKNNSIVVSDKGMFTMPSDDVTASVEFVKQGAPSPTPTLVPTNAPEPTVDPSGTEKMWSFIPSECAGLGDITYGDDGTTVKSVAIKEVKDYDGLKIYGASDKSIVVDLANKTVDGESFTGRAKFGGSGVINGDNSTRAMSFTPDKYGTVTVYFAHASSSATDTRYAVVEQNGLQSSKSVATNENTSITTVVYPGIPVYVYGNGAINLYGIKYVGSSSTNVPTMPPVPTTEPSATPNTDPTATPNTDPTATPSAEPSATPESQPTGTPEATGEPTQQPTDAPEVDNVFTSSFDNEEVGTTISVAGDTCGGMSLFGADAESTMEIVDGTSFGAEGSKLMAVTKPAPADGTTKAQIKYFWQPENGLTIDKTTILTAVVRNSSISTGTDMWMSYVLAEGSSVNYTDKNGNPATTDVISRIGSKGTALKYMVFENPTTYTGTWAGDKWATLKTIIEPLGNDSYKVTNYFGDGIDATDFKELNTRTVSAEDGTFTGSISAFGFLSGTKTSDSSTIYLKSYKVDVVK